ncbi:hypothetical protein BB561_005997 [Smittium simulii]|uniref:Raptor N-terminal CASPase-like domain-containing protein n=1 Tax=Smittium simulii TaxID=133385 RepID=A0A2T9Y7A0_9FUNG|nr:hypothetical protein BB561_005997 [Smittium simulii]
MDEEIYDNQDVQHLLSSNNIFNQPRSLSLAQMQVEYWRNDKARTNFAIIALCLNLGTDPPDLSRPEDTFINEAGIDPFEEIDENDPRLYMDSSKFIEDEKGKPRLKTPIERIGDSVVGAYYSIAKSFQYKLALDPPYEALKNTISLVRRDIKEDRLLFHYNGHGVPKPSPSGDIWVFNKSYSQYIPLSAMELSNWAGSPTIYIWDVSNSEAVINAFQSAARLKQAEAERLYLLHQKKQLQNDQNSNDFSSNYTNIPQELTDYFFQDIHLGPTKIGENIPLNPDIPTDLFTACLTKPVETALKFHATQKGGVLKELFDKKLPFPGTPRERRSPLGELTWILTSITDSIAWDVFSRPKFKQLFRQDVMVASLCRNFILASRIMRYYGSHPVSYPNFPSTHLHKQWEIWDLEIDKCVQQLPKLMKGLGESNLSANPKSDFEPNSSSNSNPNSYRNQSEDVHTSSKSDHKPDSTQNKNPLSDIQHLIGDEKSNVFNHDYIYKQSDYFNNCLDSFNIWLQHAKSTVMDHMPAVNKLSSKESDREVDGRRAGGIRSLSLGAPAGLEPPKELPIVLQVLLSQIYRHNALALLYNFLLLGPWAVDLVFAIGISPFIVKLLGTASNEITGLLILVWSKLVAGDPSCLEDLIKNDGYRYFINYLGQTAFQASKINLKAVSKSGSNQSDDDTSNNTNILRYYSNFTSNFDSNEPNPKNPANLSNLKNLNIVTTSACFVLCVYCGISKEAKAAVYSDDTLNYLIIHLQRPDDGSKELALLKIWALLTLSALLEDCLEVQWMSLNYRERIEASKKRENAKSEFNTPLNNHINTNSNDKDNNTHNGSTVSLGSNGNLAPYEIVDIPDILVALSFHYSPNVRAAAIHTMGSLLKGLSRLLTPNKSKDIFKRQNSDKSEENFNVDPLAEKLVDIHFSDYFNAKLKPKYKNNANSFLNTGASSANSIKTSDNAKNAKPLPNNQSPTINFESCSRLNLLNPEMTSFEPHNVFLKVRNTEKILCETLMVLASDGSPVVRREVVNVIGNSIFVDYSIKFIRAIAIVASEESKSKFDLVSELLESEEKLYTPSSSINSSNTCDYQKQQNDLNIDLFVKLYKTLLSLAADPHIDVSRTAMKLVDILHQVYTHSCYFILIPQLDFTSHITHWAKESHLSLFAPPVLANEITTNNNLSNISDYLKNEPSKTSRLNQESSETYLETENSKKGLARSQSFFKNSLYQSQDEINDSLLQKKHNKSFILPNDQLYNLDLDGIDKTSDYFKKKLLVCNSSINEYEIDQSQPQEQNLEQTKEKKSNLLKRITKLQSYWIDYAIKKIEKNVCVSQIYDWEGAYFLESDLINSMDTETNDEILIKLEKKRDLLLLSNFSSKYKENSFTKPWTSKTEIISHPIFNGPTQIAMHPVNPHMIVSAQDNTISVIDYESKSIISRFEILNTSSEIYAPVKDMHLINPNFRTMLLTMSDDGVANVFNGYAPGLSIDDMEQHEKQLLSNNFDISSLKFPSPKLTMTFRAVPHSTPKKNMLQRIHSLGYYSSDNVYNCQTIGCGAVSDYNQTKGYLYAGSERAHAISVWNLETEQIINNMTSRSIVDGISSISTSHDGNLVIAGNNVGVVRVYDIRLAYNNPVLQMFLGHGSNKISSSKFMDSIENRFYTSSIDGKIVAWDIRNSKELFTFGNPKRKPYDNILRNMVIQKSSPFLVTSSNYSLNIYNSDGNDLGEFSSIHNTSSVAQESILSSIKSNLSLFANDPGYLDTMYYYDSDIQAVKSNLSDKSQQFGNISSNLPISGKKSQSSPLIDSLNLANYSNAYSKILNNGSYLDIIQNLHSISSHYSWDKPSITKSDCVKDFAIIMSNLGYLPRSLYSMNSQSQIIKPVDLFDYNSRNMYLSDFGNNQVNSENRIKESKYSEEHQQNNYYSNKDHTANNLSYNEYDSYIGSTKNNKSEILEIKKGDSINLESFPTLSINTSINTNSYRPNSTTPIKKHLHLSFASTPSAIQKRISSFTGNVNSRTISSIGLRSAAGGYAKEDSIPFTEKLQKLHSNISTSYSSNYTSNTNINSNINSINVPTATSDDLAISAVGIHPYLPKAVMALEDGRVFFVDS